MLEPIDETVASLDMPSLISGSAAATSPANHAWSDNPIVYAASTTLTMSRRLGFPIERA
jgi:hypothetical protein